MLVLAGKPEILRQVALADQHHADARDLAQDLAQVADGAGLLAHDDHQDLAIRRQRPDVGAGVVLRLARPQ